jgi:tRNA uridine 5-carbamoylmethylation protein Kti12
MTTQWKNQTDQMACSNKDKANKQFYGILTQLVAQYDKPENFDSLASVEYKLSIATRKVQNQIIDAMENTKVLEDTDEKAKRLVLESE